MKPSLQKNDRVANAVILVLSLLVFTLVGFMRRYKIDLGLGDQIYELPKISAVLNSLVAILLVAGLTAIKSKNQEWHKRIMLTAVCLSILFLFSYIMYHLSAVETPFGGEGISKTIYYSILISHILLAGISLPFILFSVYRGLTGEYAKHKRLVRWVWPVWFYVSVSGVIVYLMISPYYIQ